MILLKEKLETLLKANWTEFIDHKQLMLVIKQHVDSTEFPVLEQDELPKLKTQFIATKFEIESLEMWIEYSIPKENGLIIGTIIFDLKTDSIKQSFGSFLKLRQQA